MRRRLPRRPLIAGLAVVAALALAPAAWAVVILIGDSSGTPTENLCAAQLRCTYVNYSHGSPSDVVSFDGHITSFAVRAGSVGGQVRLRVLRPVGNGRYQFVASSQAKTVKKADPDLNIFSVNVPVEAGDVLGVTNRTSGIYMRPISGSNGLRYFDFDQDQSDGATGAPAVENPGVHLLMNATLKPSGF